MKTNDDYMHAGRSRLQALLPWARAEARKSTEVVMQAISPLGDGITPYITEDNLDALLVYPAPLGGWHADIKLKSVPHGFPNVLGTPSQQPCRTQKEAEEQAKRLLVMVLVACEKNLAASVRPQNPVFMLFEWVIELRADLYASIEAALIRAKLRPNGLTLQEVAYPSTEHAVARISAMLAEHFPGGFTPEALSRLPEYDRSRFIAVLHIAALTGVFTYPPRQDGTPSGNTADDLSQMTH